MKLSDLELKKLLADVSRAGAYIEGVAPSFEFSLRMLDSLGTTDSELRDDLIYTLLARWIWDGALSDQQMSEMLAICLDGEHLFDGIGKVNDDSVFKRSFSALIIAELINRHRRKNYIDDAMLKQTCGELLQWYGGENDLRGFVKSKGWAHTAAHGADALACIALCAPIDKTALARILLACRKKICQGAYVFTDGEYDRIGCVVINVLSRGMFSVVEADEWLRGFDISRDEGTVENFHKRINVREFMRCVYFAGRAAGIGDMICATAEYMQNCTL